jgi:hypothetical protein
MNNSWEDWEDENTVLHVPNKEQIKRLEERKKIEESEIALMKDFFDNDNNNTSNNKETTEIKIGKINKVKIVDRQRENELKQKKEAEKKHSEVFGEIIHDKYDEYDKY